MSTTFVDFKNVFLAYNDSGDFAVEDISLTTRQGEFIAIVGPSGCGKSTFMKLATGLKAPTRGSVAIDGAPGVFLTTNIVGCSVDAVDIGDRVRVIFEPQGEVYFPLFEKVG